jgi:hypothetical protein
MKSPPFLSQLSLFPRFKEGLNVAFVHLFSLFRERFEILHQTVSVEEPQ